MRPRGVYDMAPCRPLVLGLVEDMAGVIAVGHGAAKLQSHGGASEGKKCRSAVVVASSGAGSSKLIHRRNVLSLAAFSVPLLQLALRNDPANALIEPDDDEELLERVKGDRQKRLQQREALSAFKDETVYLQNAVYQMSKAGQAIEKEDFVEASNILGAASDAEWVANTRALFTKVSTTSEQQEQADIFSSSLGKLQFAVSNKDASSAKSSFVASASALEKWTSLTGLTSQIKGL